MLTYSEWLREQSVERQNASLAIMEVCKRLGELQRTTPRDPEVAELEAQIRSYYEKWEPSP